jgi:hypothetical protein
VNIPRKIVSSALVAVALLVRAAVIAADHESDVQLKRGAPNG